MNGAGERRRRGPAGNERGGADTLLLTLFVMPVLLFLCFAGVPFFVYLMKGSHLSVVANHALKEAEAVGYVSESVMEAATERLAELGLGPVTRDGVTYPSFAGSTTAKVLRDDPDHVIALVLTYPAPKLAGLTRLLGGRSPESDGYYRIVLYGMSEAYE